MKTKVKKLKISSFPKIISLKLFGNSLGNSFVQFMAIILFYVSTNPLVQLQQEDEWFNINFEKRDLNSPQKSHSPPMILDEVVFSFAFDLRKQNVIDFSFISVAQNVVAAPQRLFWNPPPPVRTCTHFGWPPLHSPSCVRT